MKETLERIQKGRVIAVLRGDTVEKTVRTAEALVEGGVNLIEITYTMDDPLAAIERLAGRDDILLGAGTVLSLKDARAARAAGARFLVSPCLIPEVVGYGREENLLVMPGIFTPTEAFQALSLGAEVLKLFPGSLGGPDLIKAFRGPFPGLKLVPTGGVEKENLRAWFAAGALAVGMGGNLAPREAIQREDYASIREKAREIMGLLP
ncbi:MAG TPA: bifunctional 4-hydroxy-2-oxoglutarate aldolase/2-dehydro-3-deoxy-phosphogluconate aldolase [bacterium]|nr:bifunctional 4-hydroxy-2-oxoglutarate aldolase/2-dehydro-3-deoxy-phosphogluconate aldolase [bacterium]HNS48030.1 bifunctional 4-hydroxy-2-oxoglutarate aldolase/2-dehydro-3-deoxy-phosphogluconate aldolase [bacterium]